MILTTRTIVRACVCGAVVTLMAAFAGCAVNPSPISQGDKDRLADESRSRLFADQEPITEPLTLYQATARGIKYQAEYRAKLFEEALSLGQLDVAQFDMLPKLTMNAGYSTRSNESFGFGFSNGAIAANPSTSSERSTYTGNISFSWSVLDFGMSYFRAKQLADQSLILEERRRKAVQNLVQDVRLAWWKAETAQRLLPRIEALLEEVEQAIERSRIMENRKLLPPIQTASIRRALLDLEQQISLKRQELVQARIELAALIGLPPGSNVPVAVPDDVSAKLLELNTNMDLLESVALKNRPEISEEIYKARVSENEIQKSFLALFPTLNLNLNPFNYDSNRFLVNSNWASAGFGVAFNLIKAFSLPAVERSAEAQRQFDQARRLAMAMAVMTQTRVAAVRYGLLAHEFGVWDDATRDDEQIVSYLASSAQVGAETEFELIRAKARMMVSTINRDIVGANLEAALGRIFNSVGLDALPREVESHQVASLAKQLEGTIESWRKENFSARPAAPDLPVLIGRSEGIPENVADDFRKSIEQIFEISKIKQGSEATARLQLNTTVEIEPPRNGGRQARLEVTLVDSRTQSTQFKSEFKTTLSEPVDVEQWKTLGEGAAYRVVGPLGRLQSGRTPLQVGGPAKSGELKLVPRLEPVAASTAEATLDGPAPLQLQSIYELAEAELQRLSRIDLGESDFAH
jgi:outer membrane protein TolC